MRAWWKSGVLFYFTVPLARRILQSFKVVLSYLKHSDTPVSMSAYCKWNGCQQAVSWVRVWIIRSSVRHRYTKSHRSERRFLMWVFHGRRASESTVGELQDIS